MCPWSIIKHLKNHLTTLTTSLKKVQIFKQKTIIFHHTNTRKKTFHASQLGYFTVKLSELIKWK